MPRYLTEFVGTLFFVLTIGLLMVDGGAAAPLAIGSVLMVLVYMGGPVSGGHYNPAVTLALFLRNKMRRTDLVPYWGAQLLGALAGAYLARIFTDRTFPIAPATTTSPGVALLVELAYTALLALVVLNVAARDSVKGNSYYGLAIGFTIVVAAFAGGPISGGAFNPAIASGSLLIDTLCGDGDLGNLWLYLVGPLLGGVVGAVVYRLQGKEG